MIQTERHFRTRLPRSFISLALFACLLAIPDAASAHESLASHMASHIAIMNVLAPLCALVLLGSAIIPRLGAIAPRTLLAATLFQIVALWGLHAPALLALALSVGIAFAVTQALLFCLALWFWLAVFSQPPRQFWRASLALLMTGKLFCLLGALFVFAPRSLYPQMHLHSPGIGTATGASQDQQLAGLLMLVACPLTYVLAGIVLVARALRKLESPDGQLTGRIAR